MLHINKHKLYAMRDSRKYPYQLAWVGGCWTGILKAWGVVQFRILNAWDVSALKFQTGKTAKASPEIAELIIF